MSKSGDARDEARALDAQASDSPKGFLSALQANLYLPQTDVTAIEVLERPHSATLVALLRDQGWMDSAQDAQIRASMSAAPPD